MKTKKRASEPNSVNNRNDEEIGALKKAYLEMGSLTDSIKRFSDFPISQKTLKGLEDAKYRTPTDIQRDAIGPALQGRDVLGAAITGSGKTLAFLIPALEHLFVNKWSRTDGVGVVILSPTRELAYQIFETLKKIGHHHDFSAGLIIGGKNLKFEKNRMDQCNILICTPGRLLQHMDENPLFNATTMTMLVLDEADRCLDMGFEQTLNAIIEHFSHDHQTLLFSATQTNSLKDLARLNLRDPVFIGVKKENRIVAVPDLLQQNYVIIALEDKITMLWSFIKNHLKQKIIVFLSSCKQVKYIYEVFCKLRPGISLLALYGTLHQDRRIAIYQDFLKKSKVVLFATDIASRGLDFPSVNWVVQLDCPEDVTQYIHRAGRSARNNSRGESLLVLQPSEEAAMVEELHKESISVRKIHIDPKKLFSPRIKIEAFLAQSPELKASAQRAFTSYIKSVFLMKNKRIFDVTKLNFDAFAKSLGLVITPRVRFLQRMDKKHQRASDDAIRDSPDKKIAFEIYDSGSESDESLIKVKRANHDISNNDLGKSITLTPIPKREKVVTKAALAKKSIKKQLQMNKLHKFDDEGLEIIDNRKNMQSSLAKEYESKSFETTGIDIEMAKQLIKEEDKYDKQRFREILKKRHKEQKLKRKQQNEEDAEDEIDDDDSCNSVDLSWLPDPNKLYNSEKKLLDEGKSISNPNDNDFLALHGNKSKEPKSKKIKISAKMSLNDTEVIAAQLLANQ